jgi:hypothetical protein
VVSDQSCLERLLAKYGVVILAVLVYPSRQRQETRGFGTHLPYLPSLLKVRQNDEGNITVARRFPPSLPTANSAPTTHGLSCADPEPHFH